LFWVPPPSTDSTQRNERNDEDGRKQQQEEGAAVALGVATGGHDATGHRPRCTDCDAEADRGPFHQ
jgi:hypothetical protein